MACLSIPCMTCRCTFCNQWYMESSGTARNDMGRWLLGKPLSVNDFRPVSNGPGRSNVFHQCSTRPVDLEQAGLGIGKDPYPVPAPFAGAVGAPDRFRACHHSIPLSMMNCTICALETSRGRGFSASRGPGWCLCLRWQVRAGDLLIRRGRPCWGKRSGSQAPSHRRGHWQAWRCERLPETDLEHGFGRVRCRTAGAHPTSGVGGHGIALPVDTPTIPHVAGCVFGCPMAIGAAVARRSLRP